MRKWFVVFMLFLLPLRGLVGDAMAYSMLPDALSSSNSMKSAATNIVAIPSIWDGAIAVFYHENRIESASAQPCHTAVAQGDGNDSAKNQCTACQACHLSAATPLQLPSNLLQISTALPEQRQALWHSAEPRALAKTPVL